MEIHPRVAGGFTLDEFASVNGGREESTLHGAAVHWTAPLSDEHALLELEREWARSTADPDQIARFIEENTTP